MTEKKSEPHAALLRKINELRGEVIKLNWEKDGTVELNNRRGFRFLSTDKIKANIAPMVQKHGLDLNLRYYDLQFLNQGAGSLTSHVVVTLDATLIDIDTGESITDTIYGEGSDSGGKSIWNAQTYALKAWASHKFLLADGMDPDSEGGQASGSFKPKSPQETEGVRSKILEQGVPPVPKVPEIPKPKVEAPKAEVPKAEVPEVPKFDNMPEKAPIAPEAPKPKEEPPVPAPAPEIKPMEGQPNKFKVSAAQQKAMKKIADVWEVAAKEGKVTPEDYNNMSMDYASVASTSDVMDFINKYKM